MNKKNAPYIYIMNKSNNCYNISGPTDEIICISKTTLEAWIVVEDDGWSGGSGWSTL
jgi:hypothetical protein